MAMSNTVGREPWANSAQYLGKVSTKELMFVCWVLNASVIGRSRQGHSSQREYHERYQISVVRVQGGRMCREMMGPKECGWKQTGKTLYARPRF